MSQHSLCRSSSSELVDIKQSYVERDVHLIEANGVIYQIGNLLGRNPNNNVYSALDLVKGKFVAIKQIDISSLTQSQASILEENIQKFKSAKHQNIVEIIDYFTEGTKIYIVMEIAEGRSLNDMLQTYGPLPEKLVSKYLFHALNGLAHLHKLGLLHKNLTPSNLLIDRDGIVKLSDASMNVDCFVSTQTVSDEDHIMYRTLNKNQESQEAMNFSVDYDIWSLGCTIIEALSGERPLHVYSSSHTVRINQNYEQDIPDHVSKDFKAIILNLFKCSRNKNPLEYLTRNKYFDDIRKSSKEGRSVLKKGSKGQLNRSKSKPALLRRSVYKTLKVKTNKNSISDKDNKEIDETIAKLTLLSNDKNHKDVLSFLDSFIDRSLDFHINRAGLTKEERSYMEMHEFATLFETQLKKCMKEKQEVVAIAHFLHDTIKRLKSNSEHLVKEYDHLKQLLKITNTYASSLLQVNDSVRFTLKRFCDYYCLKYSDINNIKKSSKKIESFIKDSNDILLSKDSNKSYPKTLQNKILSQNFYHVDINRWNGHKWKPMNMIIMEIWLIFYKENHEDPYIIIQLPSHLKIIDYKNELNSHPKNSCFGIQNEIFSTSKKSECFKVIEDTYTKYGFTLVIEKKKKND